MANIMSKRGTQDNIITYEHYCDTKADLANIPKDQITLGSTAVVLQDEDGSLGVYIAGSDKQWIAVAMSGGSGSGSGEGSSSSDGLKDFLENDFSVFENSEVTKLRHFAFTENLQLEDVSLPNCSIIDGGAFASCLSLTSLNFPALEKIGEPITYQVESVIFDYNTYTSSIAIVDVKGPGAFTGCTNLETISMPVCSYIGENAFTFCTNLSSINLPNVEIISTAAFVNCSNLSNVEAPNCTYIGSSAFASTKLQNFSFPKCSIIENYAFAGCYNLTDINNNSVEEIGVGAFYNCNTYGSNGLIGLQSINFQKCSKVEEVIMTVNGAYGAWIQQDILVGGTFSTCSCLETVSFPLLESVVTDMFAYCASLSEVYLPNCKTISPSAFYSCSSLTSITLTELENFISSTVYVNGGVGPVQSTIGGAFKGCYNLESINLPKCKKIVKNTFTFCSNLKYVYLPVCEEIEKLAFMGCSQLESLYLLSSSKVYFPEAFDSNDLQSTFKIYVPESLIEEYTISYNYLSSYFTPYTG